MRVGLDFLSETQLPILGLQHTLQEESMNLHGTFCYLEPSQSLWDCKLSQSWQLWCQMLCLILHAQV